MKSQHARLAVIGMGIITPLLAAAAGVLLAPASAQAPLAPSALLGTAITYQGQLKRTGSLVTDTCSMNFQLYDQAVGGTQKGGTLTQSVSVVAGLFAVPLDFGNAAFNGDARWLNIQVRCPGDPVNVDLGRQALTAAPYAMALPGMYTQPNATSPNVIGGHSSNSIYAGVVGAVIGGGGGAIGSGSNEISDSWGTIGGGSYNVAGDRSGTVSDSYSATVGGGSINQAWGIASTIAGGYNNDSGNYCAVGGGRDNYAYGDYSAIGGGMSNRTDGTYSTVPGGYSARPRHYGEMAYASGTFTSDGEAQSSLYVLRRSTTTSAEAELFLDGSSQRITIRDGRAVVFEIQVVAVASGGIAAGFRIWGVLHSSGGTTTMLGASGAKVGWSTSATTWDAFAEADNTNDALVVKVTGDDIHTIRWVATVRTTEVEI